MTKELLTLYGNRWDTLIIEQITDGAKEFSTRSENAAWADRERWTDDLVAGVRGT